jgi:hypothetical protein
MGHVLGAAVVGILLLGGIGAALRLLNGGGPIDYSLVRTVVLAGAAIGAVPAAYLAYRRQRNAEEQRLDGRRDAERAVDEDFRDRFVQAAEQLGDGEAATRMAGVYAMAHLADDWGESGNSGARQMCVDVLCAYLRLPYTDPDVASASRRAEREVRRTLIRVIRDHLREDKGLPSWSPLSFSFEGAHFDCGDFTGAVFEGDFVTFHGATFAGSVIHFNRAVFAGRRADFSSVRFESGTVDLRGCAFTGALMTFDDAVVGQSTVLLDRFHHGRDRVNWGPLEPLVGHQVAAPSSST